MNDHEADIIYMSNQYISFMKLFIKLLVGIIGVAFLIGVILLFYSASHIPINIFIPILIGGVILALLAILGILFINAVLVNGLGTIVLYCAHKAEQSSSFLDDADDTDTEYQE